MQVRVRSNRRVPLAGRYWLTVSVVYGALFGHLAGMVVSMPMQQWNERPIYCAYAAAGGVGLGLLCGLIADWRFPHAARYVPATSRIYHQPASLHARMWMALPLVIATYVLILPAFYSAR